MLEVGHVYRLNAERTAELTSCGLLEYWQNVKNFVVLAITNDAHGYGYIYLILDLLALTVVSYEIYNREICLFDKVK